MKLPPIRSVLAAMVAALSLASCSPSRGMPARDDRSRAPSLLSAEQRGIQPLSTRWLVGYWNVDRDCSIEGGTSLRKDGTYMMGGAFGTWHLAGDTLWIDQQRPPLFYYMQVRLGDPGHARLRKVGPNALFARWPGSPGWTFYRCDPR